MNKLQNVVFQCLFVPACIAAGLSGALAAPAADPLPVPWEGIDIGGPNPVGGARSDHGAFTLTTGGGDLSGASDQFHYVYQSVTGDFSLVARVMAQTGPGDAAKAGLMARDALAATSNFVAVVRTPGQGALYQYRTSCFPMTGTDTASASGPVWTRLVKRGTTVSAYLASDAGGRLGAWKKVGGDRPVASGMIYVGLCLTGYPPGTGGTATFDHLSLSVGPQPALDNGVYTVTPASAQALVLAATGAGVGLAASGGSLGQKWVFTGRGDGLYDIQPASDRSRALAVAGGGVADGTRIVVTPDQGLPSQRWSVVPNANGTYGLVPQCAPGHGLDDFGGNATPDAVIDLWQRWADDPHTQWTIVPTH